MYYKISFLKLKVEKFLQLKIAYFLKLEEQNFAKIVFRSFMSNSTNKIFLTPTLEYFLMKPILKSNGPLKL